MFVKHTSHTFIWPKNKVYLELKIVHAFLFTYHKLALLNIWLGTGLSNINQVAIITGKYKF
jgi:hypothetical protein